MAERSVDLTGAESEGPAKAAPGGRSRSKTGTKRTTRRSASRAATSRTPRKTAPTAARLTAVSAGDLPVRGGEEPWSARELDELRREIEGEQDRLRQEIATGDDQIAQLIRDSGDGAGEDQADSGSKAFEREHEMILVGNARELLAQNERALVRIRDGSYGLCATCAKPIGKRRLQAFPRATLCVTCKQQEERH
jgi:RNA polymerase-binding protein DksA